MLAGYKLLDKEAAIPLRRAIEGAKARETPLKPHGENQHTTQDDRLSRYIG
jgi:hypothetical protein